MDGLIVNKYLVVTKDQRNNNCYAVLHGELPTDGNGKVKEKFIFTHKLSLEEEKLSLDELKEKFKNAI